MAGRRHKLLAFVLEVALAVPAGVQSSRHFAQRTVEFADFVSAVQVRFEFVECENGYPIGFSCRINQWVGHHSTHNFIKEEHKYQVQRNRDRRHKVKTSTVCAFSIDQRRCNKDYLAIIRHRFQCADIPFRGPYLCPLFVRYVFAVYRPQFGIQIAQCVKVALHHFVRAKWPFPRYVCTYVLASVGAELICFLNRCLSRPFLINNLNSIREKDNLCICLDLSAIDCNYRFRKLVSVCLVHFAQRLFGKIAQINTIVHSRRRMIVQHQRRFNQNPLMIFIIIPYDIGRIYIVIGCIYTIPPQIAAQQIIFLCARRRIARRIAFQNFKVTHQPARVCFHAGISFLSSFILRKLCHLPHPRHQKHRQNHRHNRGQPGRDADFTKPLFHVDPPNR